MFVRERERVVFGKLINFLLLSHKICDAIKGAGVVPSWDDVQKNPHVTIDGGSTWVGFDNARSFVEKAKYVKDNELGGAVIWALDLDDFNARLL